MSDEKNPMPVIDTSDPEQKMASPEPDQGEQGPVAIEDLSPEMAALTVVANVLLNLDAILMKG